MPFDLSEDLEEQLDRLSELSRPHTERSKAAFVQSVFASEFDYEPPQLNGHAEDFRRILFGLETVGFDLHDRAQAGAYPSDAPVPWRELIWPAYRLRRALWWAEDLSQTADETEDPTENLVEQAIDGVIANRHPEIRFQLENAGLDAPSSRSLRWDHYVEMEVARAFLLTVRKAGGRNDLRRAGQVIQRLRENQDEGEASIQALDSEDSRVHVSLRTLALYNLAKAVEITAEFIRAGPEDSGFQSANEAVSRVQHFAFNAAEALRGQDTDLLQRAGRYARACTSLIQNSIHAVTLPRPVRDFATQLATRPEHPILEFWYAQREAINSQLLDPTRTAVVVSLPTSSGKTLLAELAIVQAHQEAPEETIVYVAPTRALVTQVSLKLSRDLQDTDIQVQVATPSFEIDPVERAVLEGDIDVLVSTPEKLDLLIKSEHDVVQDLNLVVVDEAHNLGDVGRGSRLELLLSTIRREQANARFLLLTPFAHNAGVLSEWLGAGAGAHIVLDWKPNDRVVGVAEAGHLRQRGDDSRPLTFTTLETPHSDCPPDVEIPLGDAPRDVRGAKSRLSVHTAQKLAQTKDGGVLLLATSRNDAENRAQRLAELLPDRSDAQVLDLVARFLDTEAGEHHPLSDLLSHGVAFHHAGLSPEARYLVERLVEEGDISVISATTTLAQGVHFPLSAAVVESHYRVRNVRGQWFNEPLPHMEFWNIAGRVGRTLEDTLGTISFVATNDEQIRDIESYLEEDTHRVVSSLMQTLRELQGQDVSFGLDLIYEHSALSAFLQYLLHVLAVAGEDRALREVEDVLRNSLVYTEARREDPDLADELVRIARAYYEELSEQEGENLSSFASLADGTGFSSPSVRLVQQRWQWNREPSLDEWNADVLFTEETTSSTLTEIMDTLGRVPEIQLGSQRPGEFSPERVARIVSKWVNGASITRIASEEFNGDIIECTQHLYSSLTGLVPWGMRAIQRVSFAGEDIDWDDLELLPAMVYHGVRSEEAIGLRMLGVPRFAAEPLADRARSEEIPIQDLDQWVRDSHPEVWEEAIPEGSPLSGEELKAIWEVLEGERSIRELSNGPR